MPHLDFLGWGCPQASKDALAPKVPFVPAVFDNIIMALVICRGITDLLFFKTC